MVKQILLILQTSLETMTSISKQFLDIAENKKTLYENEPILNVITDAGKDKYPFILKSCTTTNGSEPVEIKRFYKDIDQLTKSIEKMVDKYDETLEVLFSGEMIKYTQVFSKVKRSNYATGCDVRQKIIEYRSCLVYIPEANECFRKCIEIIHQKGYSQENREFIKQSYNCKNMMTQAKIQPFCRQYNLNVGFYNVKQKTILPRSVKQRNLCLYNHDNHFCVIRKINQSTYPQAKK